MRALMEYRFVISLLLSMIGGVAGLHVWPFPVNDPILGLIHVMRPGVYDAFSYAYATVWLSTPFLAINVWLSLVYIFIASWDQNETQTTAFALSTGRSSRGSIPCLRRATQRDRAQTRRPATMACHSRKRGLYTGMAIIGAVGTGKTSACMYPYVEQLLAYRPNDQVRKVGGLVLEVEGDFCGRWHDTESGDGTWTHWNADLEECRSRARSLITSSM